MLAKLIELTGLSPDTITLIITILTLVVGIAHSRGNNLPVLSAILKLLGAKSLPTTPATPAAPAEPAGPDSPLPALGEGRIFELIKRAIRDELERRLIKAEPQSADAAK